MAVINNGSVPYGSYQVTIGTSLYVAEDIRYQRTSFKIERRNALNQASGFVLDDADFPSGSMTVQRPTSTALLPSGGMTIGFPTGAPVDNTATLYYVGEVSPAVTRGDVQKFSVAFHTAVA